MLRFSSAFLVKRALSIVAIVFSLPLLQGSAGRLDNFETRILAAHNRERAAIDVAPLKWNPDLAADAAGWAQHLVKLGYLVHSPDEPWNPDPQGENLWAGTRGYYGLESMVGLWSAEKHNFKPGIFPHNSRTGELEDVGHYTQLVWRSTTEVGCALARGPQDEFLVCRYAEGGNVVGEQPF